ncbi:hypothetical protein ABBQ38_003382 [Trebouxia sp. C0009 RCD-2024]
MATSHLSPGEPLKQQQKGSGVRHRSSRSRCLRHHYGSCSSAVAEKLFTAGNTFSNRLGATAGLESLGMNGQGIIWNNNLERWEHSRKHFAKAVQEGATQRRNLPNTAAVCVASFATTQQQLLDATSGDIVGTESKLHFTYNPMRQGNCSKLQLYFIFAATHGRICVEWQQAANFARHTN